MCNFSLKCNRAFSPTWQTTTLVYWNKRWFLYKYRVQLPEDKFGSPVWLPFLCFGTPLGPPWRQVKMRYYYSRTQITPSLNHCGTCSIHDWGSDRAPYYEPKKIHEPEILHPKKYLPSKFSTQKNSLNYLNIDLFNQTDFNIDLKEYTTDLLMLKNTNSVNFQPKKLCRTPPWCIGWVPP